MMPSGQVKNPSTCRGSMKRIGRSLLRPGQADDPARSLLYPQRVSLYETAPMMQVQLEELENCAISRLSCVNMHKL
jgi:hypothetical protein